MYKTFIIGNGFDLDLGWKTSYADFAQSELWPKDDGFSNLAIEFRNAKESNWYNIEDIICEYAKKKDSGFQHARDMGVLFDSKKDDLTYYKKLTESLKDYIQRQEKQPIDKNSVAASVLRAIIDNGSFDKIFSYNYTNLNIVAKALSLHKVDYIHVHGSCMDDSVILGVSDKFDLDDPYHGFYKTSSPKYKSANVRYALQNSSEVVFFGHSLGPQDYHYFENFFAQQCRDDIVEKDKKKITFITYDVPSQMGLITQLRSMNAGKINVLYDCNDLSFIRTADNDKTDLNAFLQHLKATREFIYG